MKKNLLTESDVRSVADGSRIYLPPGTIITPSARDLATSRGIDICQMTEEVAHRSIAIAADHGGFQFKEQLKPFLAELGHPTYDFGTHDEQPVDYPDYAWLVADAVGRGQFWRGIVIDGAGVGSCMVANKVPGVRAAACSNVHLARNSREHNDANVLTLGAGMITVAEMREIVRVWLTTDVGAERHRRRVEKIMAVEAKYQSSKGGS